MRVAKPCARRMRASCNSSCPDDAEVLSAGGPMAPLSPTEPMVSSASAARMTLLLAVGGTKNSHARDRSDAEQARPAEQCCAGAVVKIDIVPRPPSDRCQPSDVEQEHPGHHHRPN